MKAIKEMKKIKLLIPILILICLSIIIVHAEYYELEYNITYTDESGNILAESVHGNVNMTNPNFNIPSPIIPGYALKNDNEINITYTNLNITYPPSHYDRYAYGEKNVIYVPTYNVKIISKYSSGKQALTEQNYSIKKGATFSYSPLPISGFVCDINNINEQIYNDKTFIITYYPCAYNVIYKYENGESDFVDTKMHNEQYKVRTNIPYKEGYVFSYYKDGESIVYPSSYLNENRSYILIAQYNKNIIISYSGNGYDINIPSQYKEYDVPIKLSSTIPQRPGYNFIGWNENKYASVPTYLPSDIYTGNQSLHLYAIWEYISPVTDINKYEISYYVSSSDNPYLIEYKTENEIYNISSEHPILPGYDFQYYIDPYTNDVYMPNDEYRDNINLNLFAVYNGSIPLNSTYTVTYDPGNGYFDITKETIDSNEIYKLPNITPIYDGHVFLYWLDEGNNKYYPNTYYTKKEDIVFSAFYEDLNNVYIIHYDANTGYGCPNDTIKYHNVDINITKEKPYKYGYKFLYWCTNKNGNGTKYNPNDIYSDNANVTLYAIYAPKEITYTVVYDLNYGYNGPENQQKTQNVPLIISKIRPMKDGYVFVYWSDEHEGDAYLYPGDTYTEDHDIVLYAVYKLDKNIYTITYDANTGYDAPEKQIKYENETIFLSYDIPKKDNCEFVCWSNNPYKCENEYYPGQEYTENRSLYLYAIYESIFSDLDFSILTLDSTHDGNSDLYGKAYVYNDSIYSYENCTIDIFLNGETYLHSSFYINSYETCIITFVLKEENLSSKDVVSIIINKDKEIFENDYSNNEKSMVINKITNNTLSIIDIRNDDSYIENEEAYISFYVKNDNNFDILPHNNLCVYTNLFTYNVNNEKELLFTDVIEHFVIPKNEKNLAYFRFFINEKYRNKTIFVSNIVSCPDLNIFEDSGYSFVVKENSIYYPDDTVYETMPKSYYKTSMDESSDSISYYTWEYDGIFKKTIHTIIPDPKLYIYPSEISPSLLNDENKIYMKSGYPIEIDYKLNFTLVNTNMDDLILPTHPYALFPDNMYLCEDGKILSLEYSDGKYIFVTLPKYNIRAYYTKLYTSDGEYIVFVNSTYIKTPAGVISNISSSNTLYIQSNLYTDWYIGE